MHQAQIQQHDAQLVAVQLDGLPESQRILGCSQGIGHVADINEIEADDQQVVHGIGQFLLAMEGVDEEYPPAPVQGSGDPDRDRNADHEVDEVAVNDVHLIFSPVMNMFKNRIRQVGAVVKNYLNAFKS